MIDHKTLPTHVESYFAAGSPEAALWDRTNGLRNAIARVTNCVAAVSPEIMYAPVTPAEPTPPPAPTPSAGEVALINTVNEVPEIPADALTILVDDPLDDINRELFLQSAREGVMQAHGIDQADQEFANAA